MKIKKRYSFKDGNQIWRVLLSDSDKIVVETRNTEKKLAFFNCLILSAGKNIFTGYQLEEKFWVGIEAVYKDVILFHKFIQPNMPEHKQIIAFDIKTKSVLWRNDDYTFLFVLENKIYCYNSRFEEKTYFVLDFETGKLLDEENLDEEEINRLNEICENRKDFSKYLFPESYNSIAIDDETIKLIINKQIEGIEIAGDIEYTVYESAILMNYHSQIKHGSILNRFAAVDIKTGKVLLDEVLNKNANAFAPDSFFVYKNFLFLLKEKTMLLVYELIS